eukprot:g8760.t1
MGPSVAGRGKPRPLLAGVFRKACDYCVRSKRGCNGGTPCEQCIRRDQCCTYSQRRKSGPRGRPLRPHQAISAPSSPVIGTRTSARRASKRMSPHDKASPSPSPSRTASMSSSSSDFSEGGDDEDGSFSSDESSDMDEAEQKQKQKPHAHKKSKISREETVTGRRRSSGSSLPPPPTAGEVSGGVVNQEPISPPAAVAATASSSPFFAKQEGPRTRGDAAATSTSAEEEGVRQRWAVAAPAPAVSSPLLDNEPALFLPKNRISGDRAAPPRQLSPLTVGAPAPSLHLSRSSSLPMWARETSTDAEQRRQQAHRYSASVGAVPTSTTTSSSRGEAIHEIAMQPWEDVRPAPRPPVTLVNMVTQQQQRQQQQQQEAQANQAPAFAVVGGSSSSSNSGSNADSSSKIFASRHSAQQSLPPVEDPMDVSTRRAAAPTVTLAAAMMMDAAGEEDFAGDASLRDLDEEDDFALCPWRIPSLTREQSLARVVAALGAEQGASAQQGVGGGFEGSYGTTW